MSSDIRILLWRVHGLAALLALPFLLVALVTGLICLPAPPIDAWQSRPLEQVRPGPVLNLGHVSPPARAGESLRVQFGPRSRHAPDGHAGHGSVAQEPVDVFVDPGTGAVLGLQRESGRYAHGAKHLHSRLQLGEGLRWMIE